jgi:hypothetical protein
MRLSSNTRRSSVDAPFVVDHLRIQLIMQVIGLRSVVAGAATGIEMLSPDTGNSSTFGRRGSLPNTASSPSTPSRSS